MGPARPLSAADTLRFDSIVSRYTFPHISGRFRLHNPTMPTLTRLTRYSTVRAAQSLEDDHAEWRPIYNTQLRSSRVAGQQTDKGRATGCLRRQTVLTIHRADHPRVHNIYRMQNDALASDTGLKSCRSFFRERSKD
jgi:hypothetical protein